MEEQRLAEKMYRRTHDAPMSRRNSIDLLFIMQRHAIFTIDQDSADHISNIIFAQQSIENVDPVKKYELLHEFHSGYDPSRRNAPRPAPKLRKAMEQARIKWAQILRDEDLLDVRVIVLPSEEKDFEHVYPPIDVTEHPFGNQLQRFQGLKTILQEEGGGMPYRLKPRFRNSLTMEVDLVIARNAFECIATPYMQTVLDFKIHPITAPAPRTAFEKHRPDTKHLDRDSEFAHVSMENLARILRQRSSSIKQAVHGAPKLPWNYPYSGGSNRTRSHPGWSKDERPFSKDPFEAGSNNGWFEQDFTIRSGQIREWVAAKQAREDALHTREPDPDFVLLGGLAGCDTYAPNSSMAWYEAEMSRCVMKDYMDALEDVNQEHIKYHQALEDLKALEKQNRPNPYFIEFLRQIAEVQFLARNRARAFCLTVQQGLFALPPKPKATIWRPPSIETTGPSDVDHAAPKTHAEIDDALNQAVVASGTPPAVFQLVLAERDHTPIPETRGELEAYTSALESSDRSLGDPQTGGSSARAVDHSSKYGDPPKQSANVDRSDRAPTFSKRTEDHELEEPQIAIERGAYKLIIGRGGTMRKVRREASSRLSSDDLLSSSIGPRARGQTGRGRPPSNKENETPPFLKLGRRLVISRTRGNTINEQGPASLFSVPSLGHYIAAPSKSTPCSPNVSPEIPKEFKVRGSRFRQKQDDALQSLKHAATKDDLVNQPGPRGMMPTLRRMVSGIARGLA